MNQQRRMSRNDHVWEENQKEWLPGSQMKKMFQERECDELGRMKMEDWPLDVQSRRLFWLHRQGQFPEGVRTKA